MFPRPLIIITLIFTAVCAEYGIYGVYDQLPIEQSPPEGTADYGSGNDNSGNGSGSENVGIDTDCSTREDGLYPIAGCSPQFLTCSGGISRVMDCPANLIYDTRIVACEYPAAVPGCNGNVPPADETTPEPETTTAEVTTTTTAVVASEEPATSPRAAIDRTCSEDGFFSYGECSETYTACTNGYSIQMNCPASLAFDQARQLCDYPLAVAECNNNESSGSGSGDDSTTTADYSGDLPYGYADQTSTVAIDDPHLNDVAAPYPVEVSTAENQVYEASS